MIDIKIAIRMGEGLVAREAKVATSVDDGAGKTLLAASGMMKGAGCAP